MEHTNDKEKATEIATDHVSEFPDYYDRLDKMEKKADKEWKSSDVSENTKTLIKRLIRENLK
jgi:translation initiation factor 2 alpha subunit (eIF-2alpha)